MARCKDPPNHATRFQPGDLGNPKGKTSSQKKQEYKNAEAATRLRGRMLQSLEDELIAADENALAAIMANDSEGVIHVDAVRHMISANILKLLKDSEDRGLGTPVQSVNLESPQGSMSPTVITRRIVDVAKDAT